MASKCSYATFRPYTEPGRAIVSETSTDVVQKALETVKTNMISDWFKKTIGKSVQPQRVAVNRSLKEEEQKWEQFCAE